MRKRTINHLIDTIFWYLLYFFPVFVYLLYVLRRGTLVAVTTVFDSLGIKFFTNNVILSVLTDLFGPNGILPLFAGETALYFFAWFACVMLVHLAIDFIIFIPRLAHKWLNVFTTRE